MLVSGRPDRKWAVSERLAGVKEKTKARKLDRVCRWVEGGVTVNNVVRKPAQRLQPRGCAALQTVTQLSWRSL